MDGEIFLSTSGAPILGLRNFPRRGFPPTASPSPHRYFESLRAQKYFLIHFLENLAPSAQQLFHQRIHRLRQILETGDLTE